MKDFDLRKYLAESKLLKEYLDLEIDEDEVIINSYSGEYSGFIEDDGTVDFSVNGYEEEREDGEIDFTNKKRLVFRFGDTEELIKDKLYERDFVLEYEKKVTYEK